MDFGLYLGAAVVITVAVMIICSIIVTGLGQNQLLDIARRQQNEKEATLRQPEATLLFEMRRNWIREEILPYSAVNYNMLLLPDRKLIITLARPSQEPPVVKTGWLVLELTEEEVEQEPGQTISLIERFLRSPRLVNLERLAEKDQKSKTK